MSLPKEEEGKNIFFALKFRLLFPLPPNHHHHNHHNAGAHDVINSNFISPHFPFFFSSFPFPGPPSGSSGCDIHRTVHL
jgi:hypothetical protein